MKPHLLNLPGTSFSPLYIKGAGVIEMMCPICGCERVKEGSDDGAEQVETFMSCEKCGHRWEQDDWFGAMFESDEG